MKAGESLPDQGRDARLSCPGSTIPSPKPPRRSAERRCAVRFVRFASLPTLCAFRRSAPSWGPVLKRQPRSSGDRRRMAAILHSIEEISRMPTMFGPDDSDRVLSPAEAKAEQADRDYTSCRNAVMRAMSNLVRAYRTCPSRACRRARRCGVASLDCLTTMKRIPLSYEQPGVAIEDVYQDCAAGAKAASAERRDDVDAPITLRLAAAPRDRRTPRRPRCRRATSRPRSSPCGPAPSSDGATHWRGR